MHHFTIGSFSLWWYLQTCLTWLPQLGVIIHELGGRLVAGGAFSSNVLAAVGVIIGNMTLWSRKYSLSLSLFAKCTSTEICGSPPFFGSVLLTFAGCHYFDHVAILQSVVYGQSYLGASVDGVD